MAIASTRSRAGRGSVPSPSKSNRSICTRKEASNRTTNRINPSAAAATRLSLPRIHPRAPLLSGDSPESRRGGAAALASATARNSYIGLQFKGEAFRLLASNNY
uniref:CDP-diacylglycerol--inositol 3-phosphatidyltransferase n=2 Tax=Oryza TaxID=4527 RepID=A0A0E0G0E0_ORYNI